MSRGRLQQIGVMMVGVVVAAIMVGLGLWQLGVYGKQGTRAAEARAAAPVTSLESVAPPGQGVTDGYGRTVSAAGRWDPREQVLIPLTGRPGTSRVVTALRLPDGGTLPVVRGLVESSSGTGPVPPGGTVRVRGVLLPSETDPGSPSAVSGLNAVELPVLAQQWDPPLVNGFVTLGAGDALAQQLSPAPVALPQSQGRSRNAAYALQWWIFAAFAIALGARMVRDIGRRDDYEFVQELEDQPEDVATDVGSRDGSTR